MTKRMLIDASHAEETRVVMLDGNRLEDYDVETAAKKQLKGNIYLARIVRVEPSLQAAFVEYGGNRHGFLAFGEIHPDYFQIPVADRQRLIALQEEEAEAERAAEEVDRQREAEALARGEETVSAEPEPVTDHGEHGDEHAPSSHGEEGDAESPEAPETIGGTDEAGSEESGGSDSGERARRAAARLMRHYKIQEVIRRRQVVLVEVVKEERGNKGAALTTYISLAGRYCVLMPNSPRGGGVSRKITSAADRKRLKEITSELEIPRGMAMIVRTAGAQRPRPEIRRDCEYLLRTWDEIRDTTVQSMAPALIYEEASLIKRAIRDVYSSDVEEILVEGEEGWRAARGFMRTLMPSHARKVQLWRENTPLFARSNVEGFLDAMLNPTVQLKSGGYLVINQTEALVAIDVNSGRSTRERGIEETALRTNLEAADEVARQLRLRDLAGLIVIDFIDMEARRHNAMVERRVKEALRQDRARIQVGAISHFGLLEMSRQRLRPSLAENSFAPCEHCNGTGLVRGTESSALHVLRAIEAVGTVGDAAEIAVHLASGIALYILNGKREWLAEIEKRCLMQIRFEIDDELQPPTHRIVKTQIRSPAEVAPVVAARVAAPLLEVEDDEEVEIEAEVEAAAPVVARAPASSERPTTPQPLPGTDEEGGDRRKKRRRRRRRGKREENGAPGSEFASAEGGQDDDETGDEEAGDDDRGDNETSEAEGGERAAAAQVGVPSEEVVDPAGGASVSPDAEPAPLAAGETGERPKRRRSRARRPRRDEEVAITEAPPPLYQGPTPADPFVGTFDIFEALERSQEEAYMVNSGASAALIAATRESGQAETSIANDAATPEMPAVDAPARPGFATEEGFVHAEPPADAVAAAEPLSTQAAELQSAEASEPLSTHAAELHATHTAEPQAAHPAGGLEAPIEEPQSGSAVQPIVIGGDEPVRARKGWWRR